MTATNTASPTIATATAPSASRTIWGMDPVHLHTRSWAAYGARVALTPSREVAQLWQSAPDPITGWKSIRRLTARNERLTMSIAGSTYDRTSDRELAYFLHDLVAGWKRPDATIKRIGRAAGDA